MDIVAIIAIFCAFIVKGMCGFANTLVFTNIMSYTASNINITPLELIVGYPSNIYIAWKERKGISLKVWLPLAIFVMIGIIPGLFILINADTGWIKTIFGLIVVLLGFEMLFRERQKEKKKGSKLLLAFIGILSGILCGLFGVGAFLVAYLSRTTENNSQFKSNICIVFFVENTFRIILYSLTGIINPGIIKQAIFLLPFMIIGLVVGMLLSNKLNERMIKKAVIILLILSGVSLVVNNIQL